MPNPSLIKTIIPGATVPSLLSTVLDQQVRNGSFDSGSVAVPATDPNTGQPYPAIIISGTLSDVDAQNAANSCRITLLASWDGGLTFQTFGPLYTWQGGIGPKGNFTVPSEQTALPVDANGKQPNFVKATIDTLGNALNTGLTIQFTS